MRKKIRYFGLLLAVSLIALPVLAQDITPSPTVKPGRSSLREVREERREEFKLKISEIKDQQRRLLLQRIEQNLNRLNERLVDHLKDRLNRLSKILAKIETRAAKIKAEGGDTASAEAKIIEIKTDIASLSATLDDQSVKAYTPTVISTDSAGLKLQVGQTYQLLERDMKALRESLIAIKNKMKEVVRLLRSASGEVEDTQQESTSSAQ